MATDTEFGRHVCMYVFTTQPHRHGHWQLQELFGNQHVRLDEPDPTYPDVLIRTFRVLPALLTYGR